MGVSFKRHRLPAEVIRHAVWLYFRFTLSLRDVEEMLAERGVEVSYETVRCWTRKFGPQFARRLKRLRPAPSPRWHLDEMVCTVGGRRMYLWRARRRERMQQGFKSPASAQRFLTVHAAVYNTFYTARHLTRRPPTKPCLTCALAAPSV